MTPSEDEQFSVWLHDRLVARLLRRGDTTRFVFDPDYLADPSRPLLGLRLEEEPLRRCRAHLRLPPWFSNLLPEGQLRQWVADARGTSTEREMELLAHVGHDLPGAVRVIPSLERIAVDDDVDSDSDPSLQSSAAASMWSFSLAGVALKFSMLATGERLTIPAIGENGDWIVKLPDPQYPHVPRNEFAMMALARAIGIDVPETRLVHRESVESLPEQAWSSGETHAYAVRRFDRGPGQARVHIEDLAQVRGFYPEQKYEGSFETVAALLYRGRDIEALREFTRRLVFNTLIGNGDAHLKNWSLIYRDPRQPTISPAYDLVATAVYRPGTLGPEDLGLKLRGSRRFDTVHLGAFTALERLLKAKTALEDVAREVVRLTNERWDQIAPILEPVPELAQSIRGWLAERSRQLTR